MKWLCRNVPLVGRQELGPWRSQALSAWESVSDASVHTVVDVAAEPMLRFLQQCRHDKGARVTRVHFVVKAVAMTLRQLPDINCLLRNGRLYRRRDADIFMPVALDAEGRDLSFVTLRGVDTKSVTEIASEVSRSAWQLRKQGGVRFKPIRNRFLRRPLMRLGGFVLYSLNVWTPALGIPKNAFGSAAVTDLSELGADYMFPPLLPFARLPLVVGVGSIHETYGPNGEPEKWLRLCIVFDHRIIDGVYAGRICRYLRAIWAEPERHLMNENTFCDS